MKKCLLLIAIISLASCSVKKESKSCTYNGQPVDCSSLQQSNRSEQNASASGFGLISSITTSISISPRTFEILENTYDKNEKIEGGKSYECVTSTNAGERITYTLSGATLQLFRNGKLKNYERVSGNSGSLNGKWQLVEKTTAQAVVSVLNFEEDQLTISTECQFKI